MEISGNKYLHKKFKKQTSCGPVYYNNNNNNNVSRTEDNNRTDNNIVVVPVSNNNNNNNNIHINNNNYNGEYIRRTSIRALNEERPVDGSYVPNYSTNSQHRDVIVNQSSISSNLVVSREQVGISNHIKSPTSIITATTTTATTTIATAASTRTTTTATTTTVKSSSLVDTHTTIQYSKSNQISSERTEPIGSSSTNSNNHNKYVCTYCNLACSKPSVLQKHIRAHTNERPYPCVSCGFSFKTRSNLYKHCRSRTHANRLMGTANKPDEEDEMIADDEKSAMNNHHLHHHHHHHHYHHHHETTKPIWEQKSKPYKPRFHEYKSKENDSKLDNVTGSTVPTKPDLILSPTSKPDEISSNLKNSDLLKLRINELIHKNNSIVNDAFILRPRTIELIDHHHHHPSSDEPLNLTAKNRKRCLSDSEHHTHKSLIKELLLKNLSSDPNLQCPYCKMIFQTVTELEMHKLKYCNAKSSNIRYARSSSVNVASILTHNKNAFDNIPHMQHNHNNMFPLKSPGPLLGKTRLIETGRTFSFDDTVVLTQPPESLQFKRNNSVKLFGGEVKITQTSGETRNFKSSEEAVINDFPSENLVIRSSLQSGGTVLQNKSNYNSKENTSSPNVIRVYESGPPSQEQQQHQQQQKQQNDLIDFGQKAVKLLAPNLKRPNLTIPGLPVPVPDLMLEHQDNLNFSKRQINMEQRYSEMPQPHPHSVTCNPVHLFVNGKVVRYVPGMPGPIEASSPGNVTTKYMSERKSEKDSTCITKPIAVQIPSVPDTPNEKPNQKFVRPNSLALKPTTVSLKTHHGLTPTVFNQALISPDTPRVAKKYCQQYLNGNYFSYLGLKSSTKSVYCTLNKTQPFYVMMHFKKLSMYSEWRQQESKIDSLNVSAYDSRQRQQRYTMAGKAKADLLAHSSYKFVTTENLSMKDDNANKANSVLGGYESNEDYTYIRGRGRGRYVCDQCGIRCKKPSMLKKHIRTHSDDRPYTCEHCNFSFKTKGNLTKHMKSKAHSKKYAATSGGSNTSAPNSVTDSDSGQDDSEAEAEMEAESSDESTRLQEHEAAHCLLSLAQKSNQPTSLNSENMKLNLSHFPHFLKDDKFLKNPDQINHVTNANFAKNKILDETPLNFNARTHLLTTSEMLETATTLNSCENNVTLQYLGQSSVVRPLTYPYLRNQSDLEKEKALQPIEIRSESVIRQNDSIESTLPANIVYRKRKLSASSDVQPKTQRVPETNAVDLTIPAPIANNLRPVAEPIIVYKPRHNSESNSSETLSQNSSDAKQSDLDYNSDKKSIDFEHELDQSAMETLAEIAVKQVKLEKNILAKNVASEYLKLALNCDVNNTDGLKKFVSATAGKNDSAKELIIKPEENKNCSICSKNFSKPSQLRLHMNIHYLERPFRCESCSVSFRTKGHLQKHERSAGHHNKLSTSPALSTSEPRPFKCSDCNIAFRIHGHLAKHLRSKMHIMKLECLAKIPFGLYAELERANSLLTEINTTDVDLCLDSLKVLAKKLFGSDANKLDKLINTSDNYNS